MPPKPKRKPLTRERVMRKAMGVADKEGLNALSMRKLGGKLGVEAMSLYNHVANKDEILDGLVELAIAEIELPGKGESWKPAMRRRAVSAREMLKRHPWALHLLESRPGAGPNAMRYYDAVIGCLREAGFSLKLAGHAFAAIDSFIYGFALQELKMPFDSSEELGDLADEVLKQVPVNEYPHFVEFIAKHMLKPGYDFAKEFDFGLDLVLDGLERLHRRA